MGRRKIWTAAEDAMMRRRYGSVTCADLARELGRTTRSVYQRANKLDLVKRQNILTDQQIRRAVRQYHPRGLSDAEIADVLRRSTGLQTDRHRIGKIRRSMKLGNTRLSAYQRGRVRDKTNEVLAAKGLQSLAEERAAQHLQFIRSLGWPDSLSLRSALVATLLWQRGPMTRLDICAALGLQNPHRTDPKSNRRGGTAMAELVRAGIAITLPKAKRGKGRGRSVNVYLIAPGVVPDEGQERENTESNVSGQGGDPAGTVVGHCVVADEPAGSGCEQHHG